MKPNSQKSAQHRSRRTGVVLVCVLVCMLIAVSMAASGVHLAMRGARASKQNLRLRQTQWLLRAGVERARAGLRRSGYAGEEWLVPATQLAGANGRVVISVAPLESPADQATTQVSVTAEYGSNPSELIRRSRSFQFESQSAPSDE